MSNYTGIQGEFKADQAWSACTALLVAQLTGVDVQMVTDRDFNEQGELVMDPPSVRVFFAGEGAGSLTDSQRLSYDVVGKFLVICADDDRTDVAAQALASAKLAALAKAVLIGARLILADGDLSAPITWIATDMQLVAGIGVAYALGIEIPGLAQFPGNNANPLGGN